MVSHAFAVSKIFLVARHLLPLDRAQGTPKVRRRARRTGRHASQSLCPMASTELLENLDTVKLQLQSSCDGILHLSPSCWFPVFIVWMVRS